MKNKKDDAYYLKYLHSGTQNEWNWSHCRNFGVAHIHSIILPITPVILVSFLA